MQDDGEVYLTLKEAGEYLKVSRQTIFSYVNKGLLIRYERGAPRRTLYKKSELDKLKQIKPKE